MPVSTQFTPGAGFVTIFANQNVTITGTSAPTGQLAMVSASITVKPDALLRLRSVHITQDVSVETGGVIEKTDSLVSQWIETDHQPASEAS